MPKTSYISFLDAPPRAVREGACASVSQEIIAGLIRHSSQQPQNECTEEELRMLADDESSGRKRKRPGNNGNNNNNGSNSSSGKTSSEASRNQSGSKGSAGAGGQGKPGIISKAKAGRLLARSNMNMVPIASFSSLVCSPIAPNDERMHYPRHLIKAFNSCDPSLLQETLDKFCTPSVQGIYRYDGIQNPHGSNFRECEGIDGNFKLWSTLFQSAPDFIFRLLDLHIQMDSSPSQCVVTSAFDMHGTRIRDIRHVTENGGVGSSAVSVDNSDQISVSSDNTHSELSKSVRSRAASLLVQQKLPADIYAMNRGELLGLPAHLVTPEVVDLLCLYEIQDFCAESGLQASEEDDDLANMALSVLDDDASRDEGGVGKADGQDEMTSIFSLDRAKQVYRITKDVQLVVEKKPLAQSVKLMYRGNLIVCVNPQNKIHKFEFVYKFKE
ncbi:hypothetical protein EON64_02060 [archaeon]|nr:MAG: hypothetical protein EON64_02060 [archaeon]